MPRPMVDSSRATPRRASADPAPLPANARRRDLQGLRAVAVLLVALCHADVPFLRGGYIGVDVFFVLSGYFITGVLLRDGLGGHGAGARRGDAVIGSAGDGAGLGAISIRRFYSRRARRILPAACLTLLSTSLAVYVVDDVERANLLATHSVLEDGLAATLFFANFHFAHTATNYFVQASTTLPSPFLHFWSLSVEEQIYVVWPTLLAAVFAVGRRARGGPESRRRRVLVSCGLLVGACLIASVLYAIIYTHHDPQAAYFSTPARVYEFAIGALLALAGQRRLSFPSWIATLLGGLGLAAILLAAVAFSANTPFPGLAALVPAEGAGLIILAGMAGAGTGTGGWGRTGGPGEVRSGLLGHGLARRPLTWIGDRSYAFYLWHYPALIVVWQAVGHPLGWVANLGLLAGALALSALSYSLIENPLRFAGWLQQGWRTAAMAGTAIGLALATTLIPMSANAATISAQDRLATHAAAAVILPAPGQSVPTSLWASRPVPAVAAAARAARANAPLPVSLLPPLSQLAADGYDTPAACQPVFASGITSRICRLGDRSARRIVVMIGDSHSGMWDPAIINDARTHHFAVVPLAKSGCELGDYDRDRPGWPCAQWFAWASREDRRLHPVATVVSFFFREALQRRPGRAVPALARFLTHMTHPVLLADMPYQDEQPGQCVTAPGATSGRCSARVPASYVPFLRRVGAMTRADNIPVIPTLQWFCARGICPMVVEHTLTVRDESHLSMDYVNDLTHVFSLALNPILTRLQR